MSCTVQVLGHGKICFLSGSSDVVLPAVAGMIPCSMDELVCVDSKGIVLPRETTCIPDGSSVIHRPRQPNPVRLYLQFGALCAILLGCLWVVYIPHSAPLTVTIIATKLLLMARCACYLPRQTEMPSSPNIGFTHLILLAVCKENPSTIVTLLSSLELSVKTAQRDVIVLVAAEQCTPGTMLRTITEAVGKISSVRMIVVRHPRGVPNEVPGASTNYNWALERFWFQFRDPSKCYLVTKCDANSVIGCGYLHELESYGLMPNEWVWFQPRFDMPRVNYFDRLLHSTANNWFYAFGIFGTVHFSFPLWQFGKAGYGRTNIPISDDRQTYFNMMQGTRVIHMQTPMSKTSIKYTLQERLWNQWIRHDFGLFVSNPDKPVLPFKYGIAFAGPFFPLLLLLQVSYLLRYF